MDTIKCPVCGEELPLLDPWPDTEENEYNYYCSNCKASITIFLEEE